ncbi:hypothetical protein OCH239_10685 [Roseivivax halodurans JCM 10272]|uniref:Uncharacterized protein n=1 Tax=Roseivivax halodurans JCM 10272 TaxID=1449350 RepID=X7EE52_9RHOB|nr:hypothetical protein OCH239_10685 [Roseivivax halodurans JCM 10272]
MAKCTISEGHQHPTMHNAISVGMYAARDKGELRLAIHDAPPKPADMADKSIVGVERPACSLQIVFHELVVQRPDRTGKLIAKGFETDCLLCSPDI